MTAKRVGPLDGYSIVVTRAANQASSLADALHDRGAEVVQLPVIAIVEPTDRGAALSDAIAKAVGGSYEWIVATSPNGARLVAEGVSKRLAVGSQFSGRFAAVGPKTAAPLIAAGHIIDLIPSEASAEGLLAEFPTPSGGQNRLLLARAETAREVLPNGLRAAGWAVEVVVAYRNVATEVDPSVLATATKADLITFTSESTVQHYKGLLAGEPATPVNAVCIGPISGAAAREAGHAVVEADSQSVKGLVAAVESWARSRAD